MAISTFNEARRLRDAGELRVAAETFLRAADVLETTGPAELYAAALVEAGRAFTAVGEPAQAIAPLRHAVAVLRELFAAATSKEVAEKAARDLARVLTNLGQAFGELDDPDAAFTQFGEALRIAREQDEHLYAWTALSVGKMYRELKRPVDAHSYLADAYEVFTRLQDRRQAALAANNLGAVHNDLENTSRPSNGLSKHVPYSLNSATPSSSRRPMPTSHASSSRSASLGMLGARSTRRWDD